ncbi:DUF6869 domain-containing protein [Ramlibacter humi]|uniref:DUF6869 domain-containing protein n=1 Tax=Ramlibacter humi TaxID=2530451 RepID=A0A4Z0BPB7_9BURK|nr:hypothetical protein [Ramlibacter humi]TFZ00274.1 hypothetical protein EZ216_14335 [Ramlibacter humi]
MTQQASAQRQAPTAPTVPANKTTPRAIYAQLSVPVHKAKLLRQAGGRRRRGAAAARLPDYYRPLAEPRARGAAVPRGRASRTGDPVVICLDELEVLSGLVRTDPGVAWPWLQAEFHRRTSTIERACLAAGPLEDLLIIHGPLYIGRIESLVREEVEFAGMLHAIWRSGICQDVWTRLQRLLAH